MSFCSTRRACTIAVFGMLACLVGPPGLFSVRVQAAGTTSRAATPMLGSLSPTSTTIWGASALSIPASGSASHFFAARYWNGSGEIVGRHGTALWSLRSPKPGITIGPRSGELTVNSRATPGDCTVVETDGGLTASQTVRIDRFRMTYFLATADTGMTLAVTDNRLAILSLKNAKANWDWINGNAVVPFVQTASVPAPDWKFTGAAEDHRSGTKLTLRFTSSAPRLELSSVWSARLGGGPIENQVTVKNQSGGPVTFSSQTAAATIKLRARNPVTAFYSDKTSAGPGKVHDDPIAADTTVTTGREQIPLMLLDENSQQGLYLGYEWELGGFSVAGGSEPRDITASVMPITENVTRQDHGTFTVPSVYYGTYYGDIDDGSNQFKQWFWKYKITRSLHDHPDEPWTEMCVGNGVNGPMGNTPQSYYDSIAATGVECIKFDFWDGSGQCWYTNRDWTFHPAVWPNGFDYGEKAHKAGLKASLYMGGTYNDCDLSTLAGRDAELSAVLERYDKGWFDIWRTDWYTAPEIPIPDTYEGVTNFLSLQDYLISHRPGYRYENCSNGGRYKGFAICRRMTFCTMNDRADTPWITRSTYYSNSFAINPVQLKSDLGGPENDYFLRTDMLGSILTVEAHSATYRRNILLYKTRQRPILRGADVYHILPMPDGVNWDGLEYFNDAMNKGSVFLFKPSVDAAGGDSQVIRLKGLNATHNYKLTFQDRTNLNCTMRGSDLMTKGISVIQMTGNNASEIIWIN